MQKSKLDRFISKYNLGGNVNSVKWKSSGDSLSTSFVTPDKSLLGNVKVDKFPFEDAELGVYQTDQLKSLINVLGDDVSLDVSRAGDKAYSLKVKNGPVSVDYVLSDLSVIADPPAFKRLPEILRISRETARRPHKLIVMMGKSAQDELNKASKGMIYKYKLVPSITESDSKILLVDATK